MKVFELLYHMDKGDIRSIMRDNYLFWEGDVECERQKWYDLLCQLKPLRNNESRTQETINALCTEIQRDVFYRVCRDIIQEWDRYSWWYLYQYSWRQFNCRGGFPHELGKEVEELNINARTIEYACRFDLEEVDLRCRSGNRDEIQRLLWDSEDCDDEKQQCKYKDLVENRLKRALSRLDNAQPSSISKKIQPSSHVETARGKRIWQIAIDAGYIDDRRQWIQKGHTKREQAIVAHEIGVRLGLNYCKYFESQWNCKNLSAIYFQAREDDKKRIEALFDKM